MIEIVRQAAELVKEASDRSTGIAKLAAILGVSRTALYLWKRVPAERVIALEAATQGKLSRQAIRPDIYPPALVPGANDNAPILAAAPAPANSNRPQEREAPEREPAKSDHGDFEPGGAA